MSKDYVYASPPLVEVIAEIHWEIQSIMSIPGGGIDPFYKICLEKIRSDSLVSEFKHEEHLAPSQIPIEIFANKPLVRFRKFEGSWPMYQLGPGLFAVNITPPYDGWASFRKCIRDGLEALYRSYPESSTYLKIKRIELRYIDAFTESYKYSNYAKFLTDNLGMSLQLPKTICENSVKEGAEGVITSTETNFNLKNVPQTRGNIKVNLGKIDNQDAVIAQFACIYDDKPKSITTQALLDWFDSAHQEVRFWFDSMVSPETKKSFGAIKEL